MEVTPKDATHALLGSYKVSTGIIQWHDNELDAWRAAKKINSNGGKVKVVPVENGNLPPKYAEEKSKLFAERYKHLGL